MNVLASREVDDRDSRLSWDQAFSSCPIAASTLTIMILSTQPTPMGLRRYLPAPLRYCRLLAFSGVRLYSVARCVQHTIQHHSTSVSSKDPLRRAIAAFLMSGYGLTAKAIV